jgi:hypothetical protein
MKTAKQAICYLWYNRETTKIVYVGYHKLSDKNVSDYYTSSSTDPAFNDAWNKGFLRRVEFFEGTLEQCISLEHYMLDVLDARNNPDMYNKTNGGGAGCSLSHVTDKMREIVSRCISTDFIIEKARSTYKEHIRLARSIANKVKENKIKKHYEVHNVYVGELANFERIQIRFKLRHNHHVNKLVDRMNDPERANQHINPIVVVVFRDGKKKILDGNHTLSAAIEAKWATVPVIYINSDEFLDDPSIMDHFGVLMNHEPVVKEGNSKEDVKRKIEALYVDGIPFDSDEMEEIVFDLNLGEFSEKSLKSLISAAKDRYFTNEINSKYNFYNWVDKDLKKKVNSYLAENPYAGCISQSISTVIHSGIGGVVNSLRQKTKNRPSARNNPKGKIFIHFKNVEEYLERDVLEQEVRECLAIAKLEWIELEFLPCFWDTRTNKVISEPANRKAA